MSVGVGAENTERNDCFNVTQMVCVVDYFLHKDIQCKYWSLYLKQETLHVVT